MKESVIIQLPWAFTDSHTKTNPPIYALVSHTQTHKQKNPSDTVPPSNLTCNARRPGNNRQKDQSDVTHACTHAQVLTCRITLPL